MDLGLGHKGNGMKIDTGSENTNLPIVLTQCIAETLASVAFVVAIVAGSPGFCETITTLSTDSFSKICYLVTVSCVSFSLFCRAGHSQGGAESQVN